MGRREIEGVGAEVRRKWENGNEVGLEETV
jgi:hypothetical protein